jgi:hypothetical protein
VRRAQALRSCPEARAQAGGLAPALARVVKDGLAKPAQRADGLLALLAAAYVGAADGAARAELERERVWAAALQPDSALLAPAVLAKLAEEDAPLAAALAEAVLLHVRARARAACPARRASGAALTWPRAQLAQEPGVHAAPAAARLLLACLLHPDAGVRREAAASAARCAAAPDLPAVLIGALLDMLRDAPRLAVRRAATRAPRCSARAGRAPSRARRGGRLTWPGAAAQALADPAAPLDEGGASHAAVTQRCLGALLAITPAAPSGRAPLRAEEAARWLLAAHHPVLAAASASPWAAVRRRGGSAADALARAPDAAVGVLMGGEGAASGRPAEEAAGQAALGAAMAEAAEALFPAVLAALAVQADPREHDALSPDDIKVFQTPPGAWPTSARP